MSGSLRENLTLGMPHIGDKEMLAAAEATGLADLAKTRLEGFELRITEGGEGLSGGQKKLVGLTRVLLVKPFLWMLDEPTATMDDGTEERCLRTLRAAIHTD